MNGTNLHLKINFSCPQSGQTEAAIADEWKKFLENCNFCFADSNVKEFPVRKTIKQAFYEEDILQSEVSVKQFVENENLELPQVANILANNFCKVNGLGLHTQTRLEIMNDSAYILKCTQVHMNIVLTNLCLGNFLNYGTFMDHFRTTTGHVTDGSRPRVQNVNAKKSVEKGDMVAAFEHDCKQIEVKFTLGKYHYVEKRYKWNLFKMQLHYDSIHSVIVDYSENNGQSVGVYFKLKYVPTVLMDVPKDRNDPMQRKRVDQYGRNTHNFVRITEVPIWGKCLGKCSALKFVYPLTNGLENHKIFDKKHAVAENLNNLWTILSRLKYRANVHVYFMAILTHQGQENDLQIPQNKFKPYSCYYLMLALMSRGYAVHDQMDEKFLEAVSKSSDLDEKSTEKALEILLSAVDENRYISLLNGFIRLFHELTTRNVNLDASLLLSNGERIDLGREELPENCFKVRKLIVTPTCERLMPPEVIMGNRVLREFGHEFALRLLFRDENGRKFHSDRFQGDSFKNLISDPMLNGRCYGDRHYRFLAWSNSQLRDHGCYMFCVTELGHGIAFIRDWMGDFTASKNVPKYMSRMGQCFTQAVEVFEINTDSDCRLVTIEPDVIGGHRDPLNNNEPYIFSDGIGRISKLFAAKVCRELKLKQTTIPAAYQIRYSGCKGMLTLDTKLDNNLQGPQLILRDSMKKFESDKSYVLEIVKHSQPSPVYLNRPLIMILDQVSDKQGQKTYQQVTGRIHCLLEIQLFTMADMLLSEKASLEALTSRTNLNIKFNALQRAGFQFTTEPFFRGLLLAIHYYTLKCDLLKKTKIEIPPESQGRTMYGVLDESSLLDYGQVFIQYSADKKEPGENVQFITGKVMVTKNPCIGPGDVRILTAVYKKELKDLYDVIVFPRKGPRPHTDEISGSDLDGDEYAVFWDQDLMFKKNEDPSHFPKQNPETIEGGVQDKNMVEFFYQYIRQDSLGVVSIAHLVYADRHGLFNPKCMEIAKKCSMAVDFPKTGKPANNLTADEKPSKYPDYHQNDYKITYRSKRLLGQLFRKVKNVFDTVDKCRRNDTNLSTIKCDPDLNYPNWEFYKEKARASRDSFVSHLQTLKDQYGIQDEFQLISGHMISVRNRVFDNEKDDYSPYNTEKIVELRIHAIFAKFRREFFDEFGGERDGLLITPDDQVQQKASAYYMVTYDASQNDTISPMLSFPWLVWEILVYIKTRKTLLNPNGEIQSPDDARTSSRNSQNGHVILDDVDKNLVQNRLIIAIEKFTETRTGRLEQLKIVPKIYEYYPDIKILLTGYPPILTEILFVLLRWCEKEGVFSSEPNRLRHEHVTALFVRFASGRLTGLDSTNPFRALQYIQDMTYLKEQQEIKKLAYLRSEQLQHASPGALLLDFVKYLSSQHFRCQSELNFNEFSSILQTEFVNKEWTYLNSVAFNTYHHIAWTSEFSSLHLSPLTIEQPIGLKWNQDEQDPLLVQFSGTINTNHFSAKLKEWSGMDEVQMRTRSYCNSQYFVVGIGRLEARNKLQALLLYDKLEEAVLGDSYPQNISDD